MENDELEQKQIVKMRRRIEAFLRTTTPEILIKVAKCCGVKTPQKLIDKYYLKL